MSTRATYQIRASRAPTATFYIHHDGYPEGAAAYFDAMLATFSARESGGYAEAFLRGNLRAELTTNHDEHGDTEYRYTLTIPADSAPPQLAIDTRKRAGWARETVPLLDFVNRHALDVARENPAFEPWHWVRMHDYSGLSPARVSDLRAQIARDRDMLALWATHGHDIGANGDAKRENIQRLSVLIDDLAASATC